jgi:hypothetical protein
MGFPVLLLLGGVLVRWGQRHHEAALARNARERPAPPPGVVRYGLPGLLFVVVLSLSMIPATVGVWLGNQMAGAFGVAEGWAVALSGVGGVLGLLLPFILCRRTG